MCVKNLPCVFSINLGLFVPSNDSSTLRIPSSQTHLPFQNLLIACTNATDATTPLASSHEQNMTLDVPCP